MAHPLWIRFRTVKLSIRIWAPLTLLLPPFLLLLQLYHSTIEESIAENQTFSAGFARVQQLSQLQEQIAQFRGLQHGKQQATGETPEQINTLLTELHSTINQALHDLKEHHFLEQSPELINAIEQLWQQLSPATGGRAADFSAYTQLIGMVQQLIKQTADRTAPRFNPDDPQRITIYSLSTHTIPALKEQMGRLRGLTYGALHSPNSAHTDLQFRSFLPILRAEITTQRSLVRNQLALIYPQNRPLYEESFGLFADYSIELAALLELLDWQLEATQGDTPTLKYFDSPARLFQQISKQIELLDQLNETLFSHVDNSLQRENRALRARYRHHLILLFSLLALTIVSILWILHDHSRGIRKLRRYLQQRRAQRPTTAAPIDLSTLEYDQRHIWESYHDLEQQLEHALRQGTEPPSEQAPLHHTPSPR